MDPMHSPFALMRQALEAGAFNNDWPTMGPTEVLDRFPELASIVVTEFKPVATAADAVALPARHYRPAHQTCEHGLVWIHGGAFVGGDCDMPEAHWVALWLAANGVPVLTLSYRKALFGVSFPAMNDDVSAGWTWANENRKQLGMTALHIGGASAGAALAATTVQRALDSHAPMPSSLLLAYPSVHPQLPTPSDELARALAADFEGMRFPAEVRAEIALNYAGHSAEFSNHYAFAGVRPRLFPPTLIRNAEFDDVRASGERFAEDLAAAGTVVDVAHEPGSTHGYLNAPGDPSALATLSTFKKWITEAQRVPRHPAIHDYGS